MREPLLLAICAVLLLLAFGFDMVTPQGLVAAILLSIPIALSSLLLDRRITASFVIAALAADGIAGWYNGAHEGHLWNAIAIGNRALAGFSIVLVGVLGSLAQASAQRSGQLVAQKRQAEHEQALRRSMGAIRSSLNVELVARAIVREAVEALGFDSARLYTVENHVLAMTTFLWHKSADDVAVSCERPSSELLSLLQRSISDRTLILVTEADALGRFTLATLQAARAICVPLVNDQIAFGILLLAVSDASSLSTDSEHWVTLFAEQATVAAAQASLFVQVAERNAELREANEQLERRGDVIRDLVYALSHDLRTPLAAAAMTMQQALDGLYGPLPDKYREILHRSISSNDELRRLAETLLLVARYESGEQSIIRVPVDLETIAHSVVGELEPICQAKGIRCSVRRGSASMVLGDETELRRALTNLVANALHWTPEGGHVWVGIEGDKARVEVRVEDDGYGVPAEMRDQLFQRFAGGAGARQGGGSGLGLYIVWLIAQSHGGTARYEPRQGGGSAFVIDLPAAEAVEDGLHRDFTIGKIHESLSPGA